VELEEYRRMAAVEDEMWFYRSLHAHLERELIRAAAASRQSDLTPASGRATTDSLAEHATETPMAFRILDAGCGTGGLIRRMERAHPQWKWTGLDAEPLACELARSRCEAEIIQGSLLSLPFPNSTFDAVVCADVLYHLDDDFAALREIHRVLRPGGTVVVNVPAHQWLHSYHDVTVHGRRRYERSDLVERFSRTGFGVQTLTHWNFLPLPLIYFRRKFLPPPESGSDVQLYPRPVEALFRGAGGIERWWLASVATLRWGSSLLGTGRKV
jgi:SAM-dependent methyltransferase